jgi:hypothetical protein
MPARAEKAWKSGSIDDGTQRRDENQLRKFNSVWLASEIAAGTFRLAEEANAP